MPTRQHFATEIDPKILEAFKNSITKNEQIKEVIEKLMVRRIKEKIKEKEVKKDEKGSITDYIDFHA